MPNSTTVITLAITLISFLLAITFHEFCHALTAYALGDDTAKKAGRLTLNPFAHIDLIGLIFLLLFRIGWAKPVPFDAHNFKYPRFYSILVGLAGPAANFLLAFVCLYLAVHGFWQFAHPYEAYAILFLKDSSWINVMLGVFNLLPIPPLDGSHLIAVFIPERFKPAYYRFAQYSFVLLIILLNIPTFNRALFSAIKSTSSFLQRAAQGKPLHF